MATVNVMPNPVSVGYSYSISGSGFDPGDRVYVGAEDLLGGASIDDSGNFLMPEGFFFAQSEGEHDVTVWDGRSRRGKLSRQLAQTTVTVTA